MRSSIRFRITAIAAVAVAGVLVVGGFALVALQRSAVTEGIDRALEQRADDIAALSLDNVTFSGGDEGFAQLVGSDGAVIAATTNLAGAPSLAIDVAGSGDAYQTVSGLDVDDDPFRVLSRPVPGVGILHVGRTAEIVAESTAALVTALAITIPVLVLALAGIVWWLVGRTLQPVEDIRSEVAGIGTTDLDRRVPQPGTGDEIDRLAATMNQMLERLETSVERQRRFVADASHELRSPLTRMRSALEVSRSAIDEQSLLEDVVDMQRTVEDLLYLASADEGGKVIDPRLVDLDDIVLREARTIQLDSAVVVDLSGVSGAHVTGDPGHLTRAVRNLLDNAERHAETSISLGLGESNGYAVLTVADDGPGIPADDAEWIFERFSRLDEARSTDTGGAGLGLPIARDIAERHGGSLSLIPSDDGGATFRLALPLSP